MANTVDLPLSSLLNSTDIKKICVPIFQRPYSWESHHITQFLDDLDNVFQKYHESDNDHFFGLIVYVNDKDEAEIDYETEKALKKMDWDRTVKGEA